jgi:hypothetical protein
MKAIICCEFKKKYKDNHLSTLTFINYLIHIFWAVILFIFLTSIYHKIGQCLYLVLMKARWRLVKFSTCILIPTSSFPFYEIVSHVSLFIVRCIATLHSSLQVITFFYNCVPLCPHSFLSRYLNKKTLHPQRDSVIHYTSLQSESWTTTFDDDTSVDKFLVNLRLLLYSFHIKY